ncbi:MAG: TetR/AcrR family transcriptional regulator C-terminal domain-containing protein [Erysipelotrichales bacterium]|nr:TetR/AcrR family transcriptional regulator C-terminal domain-containing protein [Erysipelotrichales bacterium]
MIKVKNLNSSSRKTKKVIKEAFAELMHEKRELANISVTELSKRADITRSAFYTHYDSIYEVAQDIQNETLSVLTSNINDIHNLEDFNNYIDQIIEYLKGNETIYSLLLTSDEPLLFANHLNILINKSIHQFLESNNQKEYIMKLTFYVDGCTNLVIKYFRQEINYSLDEISIFLKEMFKKLFF